MALQAIVDTIDTFSDEVRGHYVERDGKFVLDVEAIDTHPSVVGLKRNHEALKRDVAKGKTDLKAANDKLEKYKDLPEEFDPEEYLELKRKVEEYETEDPEKKKHLQTSQMQSIKTQYEDRIKAIEAKHEKAVKVLKDELAAKEKDLSDVLIEEGLMKALVDAGIAKEFMKAATAMLRSGAKVVYEEGEKPRAVIVTGEGVEEDLGTFVKNWSQSDEGKPFVPKATGAAAEGSGRTKTTGLNPWAKETFNVTKQQEMITSNPVKAKELAAAAGKTIPPEAFAQAA